MVADALFSDSQAYSKAMFRPSANHLFTWTNFFAFLLCLFFSGVIEGSLVPSLQFLVNYPTSLWLILQIGCLQVLGQVSIYYIVSNFKQHIFPLISTTRKILTVIMSIFIFGHYVNNTQWVAITIVFFGMFYEFW